MSFLETSRAFGWIDAPKKSVRAASGCVQCGSGLEAPLPGKPDYSGKCFNCRGEITDDSDAFFADEIED